MLSALVCPDKFKGTLSAWDAAGAMAEGVRRAGFDEIVSLPLADGGEGTLDALVAARGGSRRKVTVTGPLGDPVDAEWALLPGGVAVVEMARASGLALVAETNDPLTATTHGTGELIRAALDAGAGRILVAVGGSATTDGGLGALEALDFDLRGADVEVACDVTTTFVDAARFYGPQKGADAEMVVELERRLEALAERYRVTLGVDVRGLPGAGAAGGLAGGLAAAGARLVPGAALVADVVGLRERLSGAFIAITGEGRLDATSLTGKVVGHVLEEARALRTPVAVVAGDVEPRRLPPDVPWRSLVERAGSTEVALRDAALLAADAAESLVREA